MHVRGHSGDTQNALRCGVLVVCLCQEEGREKGEGSREQGAGKRKRKRGKEEKKKRGKEEKRKRGNEETRKRGNEETRKRRNEEKRKRGKEEKRKRGKEKCLCLPCTCFNHPMIPVHCLLLRNSHARLPPQCIVRIIIQLQSLQIVMLPARSELSAIRPSPILNCALCPRVTQTLISSSSIILLGTTFRELLVTGIR